MPRGSYCWSAGSAATCADSASVDALLSTGYLEPYRTAGGISARVVFSAEPNTSSFRLLRGPPGAAPLQGSRASISIPTAPPEPTGTYIYDVTGIWPEGRVDFYLSIQLIPGGA